MARVWLMGLLFGHGAVALAQEASAEATPPQETPAQGAEVGDTEADVRTEASPSEATASDANDFRALAQLEGATEEARMRFALGQRYYQTGRFAAAAVEFRASYELTQLKDLLYNVFLAHREAGNLDGAIEALEAFIDATPPGNVRESARSRLRTTRALRDRLAAREAPSEPPTEPEPELPEAEPEPPPVEAVPPQPQPEPTPVPARSRRSPAPWIVAAGGGALVLASIAPGALARSDDRELNRICTDAGCPEGFQSIQDRGRRRAIASDVLLFGGIAIGAGGLLWGLLRPSDDESAAFRVACSPAGCTAAIGGAL